VCEHQPLQISIPGTCSPRNTAACQHCCHSGTAPGVRLRRFQGIHFLGGSTRQARMQPSITGV
jgi:hypothetical protein